MKFVNDLKNDASEKTAQIKEIQNRASALGSEVKKKESEIKTLKQLYSEDFSDETLDQIAVLEAEVIGLKAKSNIMDNAIPVAAKGSISIAAVDIAKDIESEVVRLGLNKKRDNIEKQLAMLINVLKEYRAALNGFMEEGSSIVEVKSCLTKETISEIQRAFDVIGSAGDIGKLESHEKYNDIKEMFLEISSMCAQLTYCINR